MATSPLAASPHPPSQVETKKDLASGSATSKKSSTSIVKLAPQPKTLPRFFTLLPL